MSFKHYGGNCKGTLSLPSMTKNPGQVAKSGPSGGSKPAMTGNRPAAKGPTGGAKVPANTGNQVPKPGKSK